MGLFSTIGSALAARKQSRLYRDAVETDTTLRQTELLPILGRHGQRMWAYAHIARVAPVDVVPKIYPAGAVHPRGDGKSIKRADDHQQTEVSPHLFEREDGKLFRIRGNALSSDPRFSFNAAHLGGDRWKVKGGLWTYGRPGVGGPDTYVGYQISDTVLTGAEGWIVLYLEGSYADNVNWQLSKDPVLRLVGELKHNLTKTEGIGTVERTGSFGMIPVAWVSQNRFGRPTIFTRARVAHIPPLEAIVITPETHFNVLDTSARVV